MIEILDRYTRAVLYSSATAPTIAEAVSYAVAVGARLHGANLHGANLVRARLDGANLHGANLEGASLHGANLEGASLVRARLDGANLVRARLHGAKILGILQIAGSRNWIVAIATEKTTNVQIGCRSLTIEIWLKQYTAIGAVEGYTPTQIAQCGAHLRHIETWAAALRTEAAA